MPTLPQVLSELQFISYETALLALVFTAGLILITRDWRLLILALLGQYIVVGLMLSRLVRPDIAVLNVLIGAFVCPILFLSARQVSASTTSAATVAALDNPSGYQKFHWAAISNFLLGTNRRRQVAPTGAMFRLVFGLLLLLIAVTVARSMPLSPLSPAITTAIYWLVLAGLGVLMLTEDPMKAGHGLFTLLTGFGLYYVSRESSLLLTGLWGSVNLLLALSIGYLTVVRGARLEEDV
ncbi:MAG: hypothetical protein FOGNACKC_04254 [Anaerolineae bacterium]|nr:hypothetical protein [Anaerolineae bacterium]